MVKICADTYSSKNEEEFKEHFEKYPFELSTFQKHAIEAVVKGHHVLVTAHTGSGKTLPAEFAIEHMVKKGKKVIYTAPIKALSNQKFYEFTKKYTDISFGILTGDIKTNPEADVLIMTTEILLNTLYNKQSKSISNMTSSLIDFDMDFDNELGCVIFDEVHYVNDPDRGRVWEESIMMMPEHVQMVMLSATIDTPERFARWCETRGNTPTFKSDKFVYLASTNHRVVPLTHYAFLTTTSGVFKTIKDKATQQEIKEVTNKLLPIQSNLGHFSEPNYHKIKKTLDLFEKNRLRMNRQHVLNSVCKHMVEKEMLPALCFVLSRKQLEICANEITVNLLEFDSKVPYIVKNECEQIIRKLPNYEEYLHLPEYVNAVALLEKGIAIHHSGVMPVIKEMVELLYAKGYIKILFATETFSIGVNMPTKTVLFTSSSKFDGNVQRTLYSHEYTQMAGRAGRRGIDKVGHVIHLSNLFPRIDLVTYKKMMHGKPQSLVSKFKISYNLLLNLVDMGDNDFVNYAKRSMIQNDIEKEIKDIHTDIQKSKTKLMESVNFHSPSYIVDTYVELLESVNTLKSKKRKEAEKQIASLQSEWRFLKEDVTKKHNQRLIQADINDMNLRIKNIELFMNNSIDGVMNILENKNFINKNDISDDEQNNWSLTTKGKTASCLREVHCLVFSEIIHQERLYTLTSKQLVTLFSCFTNVNVSDEIRRLSPSSHDDEVNIIMNTFKDLYDEYESYENCNVLSTGSTCEFHYDLMTECANWCDCESVEDCKRLLQKLEHEKEVFLGEFVKALMKINNIAGEMEKIAEMEGRMDFLSSLREIPRLTMKYVVTNQSLYI
jgi:superfamily II RNA helicase